MAFSNLTISQLSNVIISMMRNKNQIYQKALELAEKHLASDPSHGSDHIKRVLQLVDYIVEREKSKQKIDLKCLRLAAILHDLGSEYRINLNRDFI